MTAEELRKYFVGREQPFVLQRADGSYSKVDRLLADKDLEAHINGQQTVGTYTIREDNTVRAVTFDIDSGNWADVLRIAKELQKLNTVFSAWTSGRKGYHVIVAMDPPIDSHIAYALGEMVKTLAGLEYIESFPKQAGLSEKVPLGALTKLPGGIHQVTGNRTKLVWGRLEYSPFRPEAISQMAALDSHVLDVVRGRKEPKVVYATPKETKQSWLQDLFDGEVPGGRNRALYQFRGWLREKYGFPSELVRLNVEWVNENCLGSPLDEEELERTVLRED